MSILRAVHSNLPSVIDLFSGCGGFALGFKTSGFEILHGIEIIKEAAATASYNLHWKHGINNEHTCGDITELEPEIFYDDINKDGCIVIGGPPCQAYSRIGRAKLRSLGEDRVHTNDTRGLLYQDFLRFGLGLNAKAIVMENVPEASDFGGLNIPQHVCEILEEEGYEACWTILNAADFGVPQIRERAFVFAIRKDIDYCFDLPVPTHKSADGKLTQNQKKFKKFAQYRNFRLPNAPRPNLPKWVSVGDAISDLPSLFPTSRSKYKLHKLNIFMDYKSIYQNDYQYLMRTFDGEEEMVVSGHGYRKTIRDFPIFEKMNQGDNYIQASIIADQLFLESCKARSINKFDYAEEYEQLRKQIVPPYDRSKFKTKWLKLTETKPSHTVVAHLDTDTYSHIHPWEARGISVREAARLQSFPDNFVFQCSMSDAFKQIGNAVPPLLARSIADTMKNNIMKAGK